MSEDNGPHFQGPPGNMDFQARPSMIRPGMQGPPPNNNFPPPGMRPPGNFPPFSQTGFPNQMPPFRPPFPGGPLPPTNQTLPKPPIYDKDGQIWLEACSADGKVYYFNAKTRETRWDRPGTDSAADTNKDEEDNATVKDDVNKEQQEQSEQVNGEEMKETPHADAEMSEAPIEEEKKEDKEDVEKPEANENAPSTNESATNEQQPTQQTQDFPMQQGPTQRPQFPPQGMPPTGMPPPFGMPPMMRPPGMPPPGFPNFLSRMPQGMVPSRFPPFPGFRLPPPDFSPQTIGDWTEHRLPDGRLYYFNNKTKESKWDKPEVFKTDGQENPAEKSPEKKKEDKQQSDTKPENDRQKPIASRPIPGTGWHLVWTGTGKLFFFNPTSKTSIWERPKELENNLKVDEILKQGPNPDTKEETILEDVKKVKEDNDSLKRTEKEVAETEPTPKKKKVQETVVSVLDENIKALPVMEVDNKIERNQDSQKQQIMKEAEVKKAIIPFDERMTMFTSLLREKQVSAFSTWDKELHKILFDPRYLLLTMRERKQCYEKYVKVRAVEERKERIQKLKEKKEDFKKLLDDVISSSRITFSDFAAKNSKDPRYKVIEKMREREQLFNEFMTDFRKHEKERLKVREEKLRKHFFELLRELNSLNEDSDWKKVKVSIQTDRRYELIGSSSKREQFFYEFIKQLAVENNDAKSPTHEEDDKKEESKPDTEEEEEELPPSPSVDPEAEAALNKSERIEASIRKREEEVRAQKAVFEKDRQKERGLHLHDKAVQHFKALLADMVKDTGYSWKETRRSLRKDPRWSALDVLDKSEKETLFNDHTKNIRDKRKKSFRKLLAEADVPLDAYWRDVRRQIKHDPRYSKFGTSELREEEFESYLRERLTAARSDFRELLRETKLITYKSKDLIQDTNHLKDITSILKKDKRYLVMSTLPDERERILKSHIDELHKRGMPPPPTATNPASRYKKD